MTTLTEELAGRTEVVGETFTGGLSKGDRLAGVTLVDCRLEGCLLTEAVLAGCRLEGCTIEGADLSGARLPDTVLDDCTFVDVRALGTAWGSLAQPTIPPDPSTWRGCRLDLGAFGGADLSGATFEDCRLTDADLDGTVLRDATLRDCELAGARFVRAVLRDADLRGSTGYVIDPRETEVRGLQVDPAGALGLLVPFGIEVG